MIDYHSELYTLLSEILPTYYEMTLTSDIETPCISYMLLDNPISVVGDSVGYSRIQFQIKVWGNKINELNNYAILIDSALQPLYFKRIGCRELYDKESSMIQKIMTYENIIRETY